MLRCNKDLARYPKNLWLAFKFAIGYSQVAGLSYVLCTAAFAVEKTAKRLIQTYTHSAKTMKLTDQIERELMKSNASPPAGSGFGNSSGAFTTNGAWLTAGLVALAATIWLLAWQ